MQIKRGQIAAQLYTLRDYLKTPDAIAATLKKVKSIGFEAVQASGLGPIDDKELAKILDGEGLVCCATHEPGKTIVEEPQKVADKLDVLKCGHVAYPYPHTNPASEADYIALARQLDCAGAVLAKAGKTLSYHNHAIEFERFNGRLGLEIIYAEAKPENLKGEIDTYWVQYGGGSPADWCRRLKGRLPLLHLKDYGIVKSAHTMFEVGGGSLDWKGIVKAAKASGCQWFIIEEDVCRFDPFDSLKMSFEFLLNEVK